MSTCIENIWNNIQKLIRLQPEDELDGKCPGRGGTNFPLYSLLYLLKSRPCTCVTYTPQNY